MHCILFYLFFGQLQLSCIYSGIIFPAACKIIFHVYNLRHKLDYLLYVNMKLN